MEIKIKNVAKVKKADIVINGVTVIAGYNGTGKSTVCKSLYSMCNSFGKLNLSVKKARRSSIYSCVNEWEQSQHSDENAFFYSDLADKFLPEIDKVQIKLESMTYEDVSKILNLCNVKAEEDSIQELFIQLKRVIDLLLSKIFQSVFLVKSIQ
jgi:predicted ATPase